MLEPEKTLVIANPAARGGWVGKNWDELSKRLRRALGPVDLVLSEHVGHGSELARTAVLDGKRTLVSFGGDGTHSEVCDGIMHSRMGTNVAMGILHAGTGGDFRRMIEGSDDFDTACAVLKKHESHPIDTGWVEYVRDDGETDSRYFLNITSLGMSGLVDRMVADLNFRGSGAYLLATLRAQQQYKPAGLRLFVDDDEKGEFDVSALCVCNGRWAGGGMMFAPNASLSDGLFDVTLIQATNTLRGLPIMAGVYRGTHIKSRLVSTFRGKTVRVEMLRNTAWMDIDGEAPGTAPASFRIHPGATNLIGLLPEFV